MNPQSRILFALGRLSALTSVLRTRADQDTRDKANGAVPGELHARMEATAQRVESAVADLERLV